MPERSHILSGAGHRSRPVLHRRKGLYRKRRTRGRENPDLRSHVKPIPSAVSANSADSDASSETSSGASFHSALSAEPSTPKSAPKIQRKWFSRVQSSDAATLANLQHSASVGAKLKESKGLSSISSLSPTPSSSKSRRSSKKKSLFMTSLGGPRESSSDVDASKTLVMSQSVKDKATEEYLKGDSLRLKDVERSSDNVMEKLGSKETMIGIYADPSAQKDDWGADFELDETTREGQRWIKADVQKEEDSGDEGDEYEFYSAGESDSETKEEILGFEIPVPVPRGDLKIPLERVEAPGFGFLPGQISTVALRLLQFLDRHIDTILEYFQEIANDKSSFFILEEAHSTIYSRLSDSDVAKVGNDAFSVESVLSWKLEFAKLQNDRLSVIETLAKLANAKRNVGNLSDAFSILEEALAEYNLAMDAKDEIQSDILSQYLSLRVEVDVEWGLCFLHQNLFDDAISYFEKAMVLGTKLCEDGSARRDLWLTHLGCWWTMRIKFFLAEALFASGKYIEASRYFSEYALEALARMTGLTVNIRQMKKELDHEILGYCLFSPSQLAVCFYFLAVCLVNTSELSAAFRVCHIAMQSASKFRFTKLFSISSKLSTRISHALERAQDWLSGSRDYERAISNATGGIDLDVSESFFLVEEAESEDWDAEIARDLGIKIERCGENGVSYGRSPIRKGASASDSLSPEVDPGMSSASLGRDLGGWKGRSSAPDLMAGTIATAILRSYLSQLHAISPAQSLFPKPTEPFSVSALGPKDHEHFLETFVSSRIDAVRQVPIGGDADVLAPKDSEDPMKEFRAASRYVDPFSQSWAKLQLQTVWKLLRGASRNKRVSVRQVLQSALREYASYVSSVPVIDEKERGKRLAVFSMLLEAMKLARELLNSSGTEAFWFSRAVDDLMDVAASPSAKARVELFRAETRAHYGVTAVYSPLLLKESPLPNALQNYVFQILEDLYLKVSQIHPKEDDDISVYADVASTFFLVASGFSPITGEAIDVRRSEMPFVSNMSQYQMKTTSIRLLAELRRVHRLLPRSAAIVKAKVSFAIALHYKSNIGQRSITLAERFLFDGLLSLYSEEALLSPVGSVSAIGPVCTPLAEAMLRGYGTLTLQNSKYRYGIVALKAAIDARRARNPKGRLNLSSAREFADAALSKNDWLRALTLLYSLRHDLHPNDGHRNEFAQLCLVMYNICHDAGCFEAAAVPLHAYRALIHEETLDRYHRMLAGKRNKVHLKAPYRMSGLRNRSLSHDHLHSLLADSTPNAKYDHRARSQVLASPYRKRRFTERLHWRMNAPHLAAFENTAKSGSQLEGRIPFVVPSPYMDAERFRLEYLHAKLALDKGNLADAESRCGSLLQLKIPRGTRHEVFEIMARVRLKRREIINCLEILDKMEEEYRNYISSSQAWEESRRTSFFARSQEVGSERDDLLRRETEGNQFYPQAVFLRLSALRHGGRLSECLTHADNALARSPEESLRTRAKLHYHRGQALLEMCALSSPPSPHGNLVDGALSAFESSSSYYDAAGDELGVFKAELAGAHTVVEAMFRKVVLPRSAGGGVCLPCACKIDSRNIVIEDVEDVAESAMTFFSSTNMPLRLTDAIITYAEVQAIRGNEFSQWLVESWRLFSKLLVDPENFRLAIASFAPVSTLMRLRKLCGRIVRLVLCSQAKRGDRTAINRDLRIFEAFVSLEVEIDRRLNLKSITNTSSSRFSRSANVDVEDEGLTKKYTELPPSDGPSASGTERLDSVRKDSDCEDESAESGNRPTALRSFLDRSTRAFTFFSKSHKSSVASDDDSTDHSSTSSSGESSASRSSVASRAKFGKRAMEILGAPVKVNEDSPADTHSNMGKQDAPEDGPLDENQPDMKSGSRDEGRSDGKSVGRNHLTHITASENDEPPGMTMAEKVWMYMHRMKVAARKYERGDISLGELGERNETTMRQWLSAIGRSSKEWIVPGSIWKGLVYVLSAGGVLGYYSVVNGGTVSTVVFGGKQSGCEYSERPTVPSGCSGRCNEPSVVRPPSSQERDYLYGLVKNWRPADAWHKQQESEIIGGLSRDVLKIPPFLLDYRSSKGPLFLIANLSLQLIPWELFFDHICVRSLCLLDVIYRLQAGSLVSRIPFAAGHEEVRRIRYIAFIASEREAKLLGSQAASRTQKLAFSSVLRLNHLSPIELISELELGGFQDPTAVNAGVRPTGPLSSALYATKKKHTAFALLGLQGFRLSRAYPHIEFVPVPALASASTEELIGQIRDANGSLPRLTVFLFSLADLTSSSESVFGLLGGVPQSILLFTPASRLKVLAHHLEDQELTKMLARENVHEVKVVVEYVSQFSREKLIPIVCFVGQGLTHLIM